MPKKKNPIRKVLNIKHKRGGPYLFELECGHRALRNYSQGVPKTMTLRCEECGLSFLDKVIDKLLLLG